MTQPNGAQALIRTLVNGGVDTCFMNPGTSEMHFVAALDSVPEMRPVLCLFEGVATGAADGYARMADRPAATLLHLGPGLGNGLANLHNARRAHSPLVNIVGDHATYHRPYDAPLTMEIESLAGTVSAWVGKAQDASQVATLAAQAIQAARTPPGQIATLVLPGDAAWNPAPGPVDPPEPPSPGPVDPRQVEAIAQALLGPDPAMLLLGHTALREGPLKLASRIARRTGAQLRAGWVAARVQRGAGRPVIERIPYPVDQAVALLAPIRHLVLVGSGPPVAFFAYPGKPSLLAPPECRIHTLAQADQDIPGALAALAEAVQAGPELGPVHRLARPALPTGPLTREAVWTALTGLMPEGAIVSDESVTASRDAYALTQGAPPHDWLHVTGGAIGQGLPVATGAALACPDRPVFAMEADGSAMYTLQALWTQAREGLNVVTVLFANRAYRILQGELRRVGGDRPGPRAGAMMRLDQPPLDFVALAQGMGIPGARPATAEEFVAQLRQGIQEPGPRLIEVVLEG